ncbi:hypothetical protein [Pyruvatibacter sp.]|uniref:hypothetical protein n=1 Tax=Pyruvatibacter sp. TaxID=1981328 RepID=UPI00326722BF
MPKLISATVLFTAFLVVLVYFFALKAIEDWQMQENYIVAEAGQLVDGSCKSRLWVIIHCNIAIENTQNGSKAESKFHYLFIDFNDDGYPINVLRAKDNPDILSTAVGQEKLLNRILTGAFFIAMIAFLLFRAFKMLFAGGKRQPQNA